MLIFHRILTAGGALGLGAKSFYTSVEEEHGLYKPGFELVIMCIGSVVIRASDELRLIN